MNSLEILYQIFRARVSLSAVQDALDQEYSLALVRLSDSQRSRTWMGQRRPLEEGQEATGTLLELQWPWEEAPDALRKCKGAVVDLGSEIPEPARLREISASLPVCVPCLWVYTAEKPPVSLREPDPTLPRIWRLPPDDPAPGYCRLLVRSFPDVGLNLARDFALIRFLYARGLIKRVSRRNAMLAAASSVAAPPVPIVGMLWSFFATTGETMAITASQLRLALLVAAVHGRPLDFFDRISELWPIIGSAFGWRALAREMVGFFPAAGWAFKTGLAYSGTFMVGESSRLYFEHGRPTDEETLREIRRISKARALKAVAEALRNARDQLLQEAEDEMPEPSTEPEATPAETKDAE